MALKVKAVERNQRKAFWSFDFQNALPIAR